MRNAATFFRFPDLNSPLHGPCVLTWKGKDDKNKSENENKIMNGEIRFFTRRVSSKVCMKRSSCVDFGERVRT